jgi:FkbM family methyltransferase
VAPRSWRYYWPSYAAVLQEFRNGLAITWEHHRRGAMEKAVFWDGQEMRNAGRRHGFLETIVEMWGMNSYAPKPFYRPRNGDIVLDLGANLGLFSVWLSRQAPGLRILAFEPFEESFAAMVANLAGWKNSVEPHQVAIGGTAGVGAMLDGGVSSVDLRLTMNSGGGKPVHVITLEQALDLAGTDMIDLLKVDIEGAEMDVLTAASATTLRRFRRIALEYHDHIRPGTCSDMQQLLSRTHRIVHVDQSGQGYGILRAELL